ncbi:MAG TPA: hypothetical protein VJN02_00445, partial [Gammaproteobacteria bacterium]|nr:hypothetical protein [Gammaproteobacteria bacterium]
FKILSHDLFDLILERPDAVILNAGSDATIGGAYTDEHAKTIEERISHRSALIIEHSIWNDELEKRLDNEFRGEMQHHLTENMQKLESAIESYNNKNTTLTPDQIDLLNIAINYIGGDAHDELYFDENNKLAKTKDTTNLINSISTKIQLSNSNTDSFPNTIELLAAETQSKLLIKLIDNETGLKTSSVSQYEQKQSAKENFLQVKDSLSKKLSKTKLDDTDMKDLLTLKDQLTQHLSQYAIASQQAQERGLSDTAVAINRIFEKLHLPLVNLDIITKEKSSNVNEQIYTTNQLTMFRKQENKAKSSKEEIVITPKKKL